jgi:hypothetical protein
LVWANTSTDPACATATSAGGTVASVNANGASLIVAPTTGVTFFNINLANPNTWTGLQTFTGSIAINGATSGTLTLAIPAVAGTNTTTIPANTGTIAELNLGQTWTATQAFANVSTANLAMSGGIVSKVRSTGTSPVTVTTSDYFLCLDPTAGVITVNLPSSPTTGQTFLIKDCTGQAGSNAITVVPASGNIDGNPNAVIGVPYQSVAVTYTGAQWSLN